MPLALAGCAGQDHLLGSDGRPLRDRPPAPYRVAIAPVLLADGFSRTTPLEPAPLATADVGETDTLRCVFSPIELRDRLIAHLAESRALTEAFPVSALDLLEARERQADLLLRLEWRDSQATFEGPAGGRAWLSAFLWLTTWAGSLWVPDSEYATGQRLEGTLVNPYLGRTIQRFTITTGPVRLSFWQRNRVLSGALLQSFFLPPFWTSDDQALTSEALSECMVDQIATELGRFFKEDLVDRPAPGSATIHIASPVNASDARDAAHLEATVRAAHPIREALVFLNGRAVASVPVPAGARAPGPDGYELRVEQLLQLHPGRNDVQVKVLGDREATSRTIVLHGDEVPFESLPEPVLSQPPAGETPPTSSDGEQSP